MKKWLRKLFLREPPALIEAVEGNVPPALREFVYLDDVSVRSLLASQQGALPDQAKELLRRETTSSVEGGVKVGWSGLGATGRTKAGSTIASGSETTRQYVVQALFKSLRDLSGLHLLTEPYRVLQKPSSVEELVGQNFGSVPEENLLRGELLEIEVELAADTLFRFSSIITSLTNMAGEYPEMLSAAPGASAVLREAGPINRLLQQMLVGLIPLRARATTLVVVTHGGRRYVVDRDSADSLGLSMEPLDLVGVTEEAKYWKDIRRVLFSKGRFTVLCRISRDHLHATWRPVKLADVLEEIAPQFPAALDVVGRTRYATSNPMGERSRLAIKTFMADVLEGDDVSVSETVEVAVLQSLEDLPDNGLSFGELIEVMKGLQHALEKEGVSFPKEQWRAIRLNALKRSRISSLASHGSLEALAVEGQGVDETEGLLLDTEVVAIYW